MNYLIASCTADGYKTAHADMYADGTTKVYSNLTPRSNKIYLRNCTKFHDNKLVWVGAQGAVSEVISLWDKTFFSVDVDVAVAEFSGMMERYVGTSEILTTKKLRELHAIGHLPLEIKSIQEGTKVPMGVPVLTVTNTHDDHFWIVNYLETVLSSLLWKVSTNATIASEFRTICEHYAELTGTEKWFVDVQCHDFSFRGMSGPEDAARSGFGHLSSFIGTDTIPAICYSDRIYPSPGDQVVGCSIPATEHAVATENILLLSELNGIDVFEAEKMFVEDFITRKYPSGMVSYVADSFDYWRFVTEILPSLKQEIVNRTPNGQIPAKFVVRPDSGDPVKIICGDPDAVVGSPEHKGTVQCLWETFGGTVTETGHKLINQAISVIYGDSITTKRCEEILQLLWEKGFASGNVVFGVGSYTYQCNTRDTFGFTVKATHTEIVRDGAVIDLPIFKSPATDSKKKSAKGKLFVTRNDGEIVLYDNAPAEVEQSMENLLQPIWKDGVWIKRTSLQEIRETLKSQ